MDVGPQKVRKRTSSNTLPFNAGIIVTPQQRDVFEVFYNTTTSGGSLPFVMTDPIRGNQIEVRFVSPPDIRPMNPRVSPKPVSQISMQLEQLPPIGGIVFVSQGPSCILLAGTTGSIQFSNASTITLETRSFCAENGVVTNEDSDQYIFNYARTNVDGGQNDSIDWEYTDVNGTSIITYNRDTGWSYTLDPDHVAVPTASCGTGSVISKASGDESQFPGFRDFSIPALDDETAKTLCQSDGLPINPVFYRLVTIATLDNIACGIPLSRAQGFRDYAWACATTGGVDVGGSETIPGTG